MVRLMTAGLALLLAATSAAAQEHAPPRAWFVTPFTGFPDLLGASVSLPIGERLTFEPGASIVFPGMFARVGYRMPVVTTEAREVSVALLAGGRASLIPVSHGGVDAGPTLELGVMSYPRSDSELVMYLTAGAWAAYSWGFCDGDTCASLDVPEVVPSVRLGFGKPF